MEAAEGETATAVVSRAQVAAAWAAEARGQAVVEPEAVKEGEAECVAEKEDTGPGAAATAEAILQLHKDYHDYVRGTEEDMRLRQRAREIKDKAVPKTGAAARSKSRGRAGKWKRRRK